MIYQPAPLPAHPVTASAPSTLELELALGDDARSAGELVALALCGIAQALALLLW